MQGGRYITKDGIPLPSYYKQTYFFGRFEILGEDLPAITFVISSGAISPSASHRKSDFGG